MTATSVSDTSTWLPLDGLAPGFDANKAQPTDHLVARTFTVVDERGTRVENRFGADTVSWSYHPGDADPVPESEGTDAYEAFEVDAGLYFAQFHHRHLPNEAVSLVIDERTGRVLTIVSIIEPEAGPGTRVQQIFVPGTLEGAEVTGNEPAPTADLLGRRVFWEYSAEHAYEHVYLSPQLYTWQCLAGPERGLADTDVNTVYRIRPGIYVFAWREKVIPCGSVTIADHRNAAAIRSHGVLFGLDASGEVPTHFTFGAHGRLLSMTVHPAGFDPAA